MLYSIAKKTPYATQELQTLLHRNLYSHFMPFHYVGTNQDLFLMQLIECSALKKSVTQAKNKKSKTNCIRHFSLYKKNREKWQQHEKPVRDKQTIFDMKCVNVYF